MQPKNPVFDGLNDAQTEAVRAVKGPVLILAGAGSGKTRALMHRIAHLIAQGVPPWQILAVTFTNKAANEMKARIVSLLKLSDPSSKQLPVMGTFHSVCVRILRRDIEHIGRNRNFVIYDSNDQERLMKELLKEMNIDAKELKAATALAHIGRLKCEALSPKEIAEQATTAWMARMAKIHNFYQRKLREHNALDFDDLILETVRLFREVPAVLDRYQNTWRFLNVDEYQDTNHAQYLFISLLAQKHRNICVIGDPDQSIYAFRGADIRNILEFRGEYPDAVSIKLERNYRSTQQILDCADEVIAANPRRPEKRMWTERVDGEKIILHEVADEKAEAEEAVKNAIELLARGVPLNEQVVLYRMNAQSRLFEEACMKAALPYRIVGGVKFYARREVKDVLAYLSAIHNPADALSLLRVINVPGRKIGKATIGQINAHCQEKHCALWSALKNINVIEAIGEPVKRRIADFVALIERYRNKRPATVVSTLTMELLKDVGMERWIRDDTGEGESRWANIGELLTVMHKYDRLEPELSLQSFLEEVALVSEVDKLNEIRNDALTLMTLHLCKGLEFRHVMIAGCEEGIFPHANALFDKEQIEEERRLMYVGMTRAKDHLRLLLARSRVLWGQMQANEPSRFIADLPPELIERKSDQPVPTGYGRAGDIMSSILWNTADVRRGAPRGRPRPESSVGMPRVAPESSVGVPRVAPESQVVRRGAPRGRPRPESFVGAPRVAPESSVGVPRVAPESQVVRRGAPRGRPGPATARKTPMESLDFNQDFDFDDADEDARPYRPGTVGRAHADLAKGSRITHPVFGPGTVLSRRGDVAEVLFDSGEKKKLALSVAPIKTL